MGERGDGRQRRGEEDEGKCLIAIYQTLIRLSGHLLQCNRAMRLENAFDALVAVLISRLAFVSYSIPRIKDITSKNVSGDQKLTPK